MFIKIVFLCVKIFFGDYTKVNHIQENLKLNFPLSHLEKFIHDKLLIIIFTLRTVINY